MPMMWCHFHHVFLFWSLCCFYYQMVTPLDFLPPPLLVTCSKPENQVYQRQDNELRISCLWDGYIVMHYSRLPGMNSGQEESDFQPPPNCRWYRDSILVNSTNLWSGNLMLGPGLPGDGPHPPWAYSRITVQCTSALCSAPLCFHHNLSIEVSGQDVRLFLFWPRTHPVFEWQPVHLGWCARLKSSAWIYHFRSRGGSPADLLIPSNQHTELPPLTAYLNAELRQVCKSYYSYHVTVRYPHRGVYTASVNIEHGPQISLSMDFLVEPALLHVFSANSKLLNHPHGPLSLSWSFLQLSQGIVAYKLMNMHGTREWSHYYNYNPFALHSNFCAGYKPHHSKEKVVTTIYFHANERLFGELTGKLYFSNKTLIFSASSATPTYLTLNPQKVKVGTYIVSHTLGLYYSTQDGSTASATDKNSSSHYIFYQQASFSYLIMAEFVQLQLFRFSMHIYLNRKGSLFKSLGEKEIEIHVFNSTLPEDSLVYIVWFIPVQHPLLQCEWTFKLQIFDSKDNNLIKNYTFTYINHVRNATQFIPDSVLPFNPALYAGFVAKVKCTGKGLLPIILKATFNTYASKVIESRVVCQQFCSITKISIQKPKTSTLIIHYASGTEFTLTADTWINCPGPKQADVIWNIYKVSNITSTPDWSKPFNPLGIGGRNVTTLKIPSSILDDGLYLFNFTMKLTSLDTCDSTKTSDSLFVEIGPDKLVAAIAGGNFRTVSFSDQWTLNGSVFSNSEAIQSFQGLSFIWYCTKHKTDYASMTLSRNGKCHPDQVDLKWLTSSDPIQTVKPETLQGSNVYYFLLVVQYGSRTAFTEQAVYVQVHPTLILNVICIENCDKAVIPTERFCLSGKCLNCRTNKPVYYWSLHSAQSNEIDFDWSSKTTTGRSNPYLRINAFAFATMAEQSYILSLKVIMIEGQSAIYKYSFYVNGPPRLGKCVLNPKIGIAFLTKFIIQCSGFEDKNEPLTYKVTAAYNQIRISTISSIENYTMGITVYTGNDYKTPRFFLPSGVPSQNSALVIYVQVYDALGASSQVTLQATVHDPKKSKSSDINHHELHALISGPSSPMTTLRETKNYFNIGYFIYMVASVLNNIESAPTSQSSKSDLRQILLNISAEIPPNTAQDINQIILSICQVTHETIEVNRESQLLVVKKLKEVSEALKGHRDKDLGSKETEILSNGILIGLSNVLKASLLHHRNVNINVVKNTIFVMEILADLVLQDKVPGENETVMETENWSIHLQKYEKWDVFRNISYRKYCRNCFYPKLKQGHHAELHVDTMITTVFCVFKINPFPWLLFTEGLGTIMTGFKMTGTKPNGDTISIMPDVAEIIIARKDESIFDLTIGPDKMLSKTTGGFSFEIKRSSKDVFIQIVSKMNITFQVFIYLGHNISHPPIATYTVSHHSPPTPIEMNTNIPGCVVKAPYILCLPQSLFWTPDYSNREDKVNISIVLQSHPFVREQTTKIVRIALFAAECLDLDGIQKQWKEGTCSIGPETSWSKIHCICKAKEHSTRTASPRSEGTSEAGIRFLASKVLLFPNHIDMKRSLLAHVTRYPITELTVLTIFITYILLAIWILIKYKVGRKDPVIDLPDNDPFDKMRYLVTIYTGSRPRAGTKASVFIELIGQNGVSNVHQLKHPKFPRILHRGSIDTFLLTTENDLGEIFSLHVWHDNCSFGPNWYLSRVKVQNLETKQSWLFLCRKWLALGTDDFKIERSFAVTNPNASVSKIDYFLIMVSNNLNNNHLWLSVFTYKGFHDSLRSFQRLSCCLAILLSSLMINSLFFTTEKKLFIYSLGLSYMTSITIGIEGALISIPVQVIVTTLFKHSLKRPSPYHTAQDQQKGSPFLVSECLCTEGNTGDVPLAEIKSQPFPPIDANVNNNYAAEKKIYFEKTKKPKLHCCFAFMAWSFVFCVSGLSSFFIIVEGRTYSNKTSLEWLLASMISFCLHALFFETLKLVILSAWNTRSAKYCQNIPWPSYQDILFKARTRSDSEMRLLHHELTRLRASKQYQPLKEEEVTILRKAQVVKSMAYVFVKNMVCHFIFLTLILTVAQPAEITSLFYSNQYMYEKFSVGLSEVNTIEDIYTWVKNVFLPLIHNDYEPTYLSNTWSKVLGLPRMRQIRSQSSMMKCIFPHGLANTLSLSNVHCQNKYGIDAEDQTDYLGSWTMPAKSSIPNHNHVFLGFTYEHPDAQWEYESYGELNSYPSRGYSFYFFPGEPQDNSTTRLKALEMNKWLDNKTWALIIELTTFNPDADLFCSISVIFESSYIGPLNSSVSVNSYKLPLLTDQSTSQIFFLLATIYMLISYIADECCMLYKKRLTYIKTAANLINFGMKTICIIYIILLLCKFNLALELVQFYLHNPYQFIPFHAASQFDQVVRKTMGILLFLLVLKMYRYFRFMYGVRLAQKSLYAALPTMVSLSIAGAIFFFAFMSVGYLTFGQHETTFRTVLYSFTTVLYYCALAFRNTEFSTDKLIGGLFLGFFLFVMICVFVNLSQVILISAHMDMKQPVSERTSHEAEVVYYIVQKIYRVWFFLTTGTQTTTETDIFNRVLYGKHEKHNMRQTEKQNI